MSIAQLSQLRVARIGRKRYQVRLLRLQRTSQQVAFSVTPSVRRPFQTALQMESQVREASLDLLKEGESHRTLIAMDPPRH